MDMTYTFLFFRFLNFFLILIGLTYVFIKYFIPYIQQVIEQEKRRKKELQDKHRDLQQHTRDLVAHIAYEKAFYEQISNKIILWQNLVSKNEEDSRQKKQLIHQRVSQERHEQRNKSIVFVQYASLARKVVKEFEREMLQKFSKKSTISEFTEHAIHIFDERK